MSKPQFISRGVFPSNSDDSPLKPRTPPINILWFIDPESIVAGVWKGAVPELGVSSRFEGAFHGDQEFCEDMVANQVSLIPIFSQDPNR